MATRRYEDNEDSSAFGSAFGGRPRRELLGRPKIDRATVLRRQAERLLAKAEEIDALPDEPAGLDDGTSMVLFDKTFEHSGRTYRYAAVRVEGLGWYTTGVSQAAGKTWAELLEFVFERSVTVELWEVTGMIQIGVQS